MKKLIVSLLAFGLIAHSQTQAGPVESSQQVQQQTAYGPTQEWYQDREWNFDLFGTYAFTSVPYRTDRYLGVDHAFGGGIDVNYMFTRYLGVGVEGYGLAADNAVGEASGNLIFRYPIPGTRFAPYLFGGGGVLFNGNRFDRFVSQGNSFSSVERHSDTEGVGQVGAGFEVRMTPNFGIINDFTWNIVNGPRNDFGMARAGIRFSF
jgi:opacity protein-like surface antigen